MLRYELYPARNKPNPHLDIIYFMLSLNRKFLMTLFLTIYKEKDQQIIIE